MRTLWLLHSWKRMDWVLMTAMTLLLAIGILFVFSADYRTGNPAVGPLYQKQLVWMGIGLICYFGVALTDFISGFASPGCFTE